MESFYSFALAFADQHHILTWCALWLLWPAVLTPIWTARLAFRLVTRTYRLLMVLARGWPPAHLDADGDWDLTDKSGGPQN